MSIKEILKYEHIEDHVIECRTYIFHVKLGLTLSDQMKYISTVRARYGWLRTTIDDKKISTAYTAVINRHMCPPAMAA
jgi:hypothetical protein